MQQSVQFLFAGKAKN